MILNTFLLFYHIFIPGKIYSLKSSENPNLGTQKMGQIYSTAFIIIGARV